jgi:fructan beta-fructosidase
MQPIRKLLFVGAVLGLLFGGRADAQSPTYDQPFRPQVHFSPRQHWTNDPNGLVFYHGEYHLFYQYNPFGDEWGHMSWGHAVSKDLLHWQELPVAIPDHDGVMIFTGSIVVDRQNSSGLCAPKTECLVAIYTGFSDSSKGPIQNQNLAYSLDDGRTWTQYQSNPVLDLHMADFRDPSVSWDEHEHQWVMAVSLPKEHKVRFYASLNLKTWTKLSEFGPAGDAGGDWECPDLLQIPGADDKGKGIWALKVGLNPGAPHGGSGEQYFLGSFDGTTFTASSAPGAHGWTNYGKDDYCAISFNGLPQKEKPILIGWMSNWQYAGKLPTTPWRGQMSLPRQLSFIQDQAGMVLRQQPVIAPLRITTKSVSVKVTGGNATQVLDLLSPAELDLAFSSDMNAQFGLRLYSDDTHWTEIGFDRRKDEFYIDRTRSGLTISPDFSARTVAPLIAGRPMNLTLIVDRSSVEAFVQDGTIVMTDLIYPPSNDSRIQVFSNASSTLHVKGEAHGLRSIWNQ